MVMRWLAVALIEASKTFRNLRGYKGMPKLVAALRAHDKKLKPAIVDRDQEGRVVANPPPPSFNRLRECVGTS